MLPSIVDPFPPFFSFHRNCHRDASKHTRNTHSRNKQPTTHILSYAIRVLATLRVLPNQPNSAVHCPALPCIAVHCPALPASAVTEFRGHSTHHASLSLPPSSLDPTGIPRAPQECPLSRKIQSGRANVKSIRISCPTISTESALYTLAILRDTSSHSSSTRLAPARRCCGNAARLRSDRPLLLRNALLSSYKAFRSHFRFRIARLGCRTGFANP